MNTKRISRNCGVFAAAAVMTSTFLFTACNCDDDFDFGPNKQYTLADRMMTRAGEILGGVIDEDSNFVKTYTFKENVTCYYIGLSYGKEVTTEGYVYIKYDSLQREVGRGGSVTSVDTGGSSYSLESANVNWINDNSFSISVDLKSISSKSLRGSKTVTIFEL